MGTEIVRLVPDPLYRITQEDSATIFSQDTLLFHRIRRLHRKEARIAYDITFQHGGKKRPLCSAELVFPNQTVPLPGIQMESVETVYDPPLLGSPRQSRLREELQVTPLPKSTPSDLSSDKDISRTVLKWALESIMQSMNAMVSQFPVEDLVSQALLFDAAGKKVESAEKWGESLLYCYTISQASHDKPVAGWIATRDRMIADMEQFCTSRWAKQNPKDLAAVRDVWQNAVDRALDGSR